jgi:predicted enzyme related to lactoylglutathione lyase
VRFEIMAEDLARAAKFDKIFGWQIADAGMPSGEYLLAKTGTDSMGIDEAIMPRNYKPQPVIPWVAVDNLDEMIEKVKTAGGKIAGGKHTVSEIGDTIYVKDTEGNIVGPIQALPRQA